MVRRLPIALAALALLLWPSVAAAEIPPDEVKIGTTCRALLVDDYLRRSAPAYFFYAEEKGPDGRPRYRCNLTAIPDHQAATETPAAAEVAFRDAWERRRTFRLCENGAREQGLKAPCRLIAEGFRIVARSYAEAAPEDKTRHVLAGADPALDCGQNPDGRDYWLEYGFCDLPPRGPRAAKGVILWSHGVAGDRPQYHYPPPPLMRRLARDGWDVLKIARNNLSERGWVASGARHVRDLLERIRAARAQGYARVIAAGQSYGGAISLEAGARTDQLHAVLAFAPGHGSDARGGSSTRIYDNLTGYLREAVEGQKGGRIVVLVAESDDLHPFELRGPKLRDSLRKIGRPFVLFDESLPIKGHGAGATLQFDAWYGGCLAVFVAADSAPAPGETTCKGPDPLPRWLLPPGRIADAAAGDAPEALARYLGRWEGAFPNTGIEVTVAVRRIDSGNAEVVYASGAGAQRSLGMSYLIRNFRVDDGQLVYRPPGQAGYRLKLGSDDRLGFTITGRTGDRTIVLKRAAP